LYFFWLNHVKTLLLPSFYDRPKSKILNPKCD